MKKIALLLVATLAFVACQKSVLEDIDFPPPSTGSEMILDGLAGGESGSAAGNMVFVDFSENRQSTLQRSKWDLAFYCGTSNRVCINNTTAAMAYVMETTDLASIGESDAQGLSFDIDITNPNPAAFALIDDLRGDLNRTVIPEVSMAPGKVVIIGRGTGGATPRKALVKAQFSLTSDGAYQVTWANLDGSGQRSAVIEKDSEYNFKYLSFDEGPLAKAEPKQYEWDIVWSTSIYETPNGNIMGAYIFSDMVAINYLAGVQTVEKVYGTQREAFDAFESYTLADVTSETFLAYRWGIGAHWRDVAAPGVLNAGVRKDRFYVVRDTQGNYYKLRFMSFSEDDGGVRGRPELIYELLK